MNYEIKENSIRVYGKEDFNPQHILECGQIFSYEKSDRGYVVYSQDKKAEITEFDDGYIIWTADVDYFENFLDLKTNYGAIKERLGCHEILRSTHRT